MSSSKTPREPTFSLSAYNTPLEQEGADSWAALICQLLFLENGTYKDSPLMGIELQTLKYIEAQKFASDLRNSIIFQSGKHLSNIPLNDVQVNIYWWEEKNIDIIILTLTFNKDGTIITRTVYVSEMDSTLSFIIKKFDE